MTNIHFPTEIWINVLKKMLLVSKNFGDLLTAPSFDSALYRASEPWPEEQWKNIKPEGIAFILRLLR